MKWSPGHHILARLKLFAMGLILSLVVIMDVVIILAYWSNAK